MIKLLLIFLFFINTLFAFKIEVVEDNSGKTSYMKDGRVVLNPINNSVLKPIDSKVLKPIKNKVLEPYNPALAKKQAEAKVKAEKIATAKKEAVKKQFATEIDLKPIPKVNKEDIKVDKESTEFFNTLNGTKNKPVNME